MEQLQGRKALITGGSRGLGKATALALAAEGVDIAITGRNEQTLLETIAELQAYGVKAIYSVFDVADLEAAKKGIAYIHEAFGVIDILINNAGTASFGSFLEMEPSRWQEILNVNVMGIYNVTHEVLPGMIARNTGDIINVSSTAGLRGNANTTAYTASKFAVAGFSEALMMEVRKHNIRVSALMPSTIASEMSLSLNITDGNPEKVLQPEDFAELVVAQLKLNRRALLKSASLWSTNP
ncbi:3-ketoacyl-ACP reductase [Flavobacterium microcysteis]|uniref:3-ketoacyl-ACP reductase n=1 Tax=Flavobacterium microcysteis TaxID=2596891 RepID=A0A501QDT8_9FLAO|nr:3-ketoacyl-ACP reductase [Flavobacterium microcysteis]TPD70562.1 3-ketoacyl-ACP reductase [Flavobacterium microcysteis]